MLLYKYMNTHTQYNVCSGKNIQKKKKKNNNNERKIEASACKAFEIENLFNTFFFVASLILVNVCVCV